MCQWACWQQIKIKKPIVPQSYPNDKCADINLPSNNQRKGTFQRLEQLIGINFERQKINEIVIIFSWDEEENLDLALLRGINMRDTMVDKKHRHFCYISESAYILAVSDSLNMSLPVAALLWDLAYLRYWIDHNNTLMSIVINTNILSWYIQYTMLLYHSIITTMYDLLTNSHHIVRLGEWYLINITILLCNTKMSI